GRERAFRARAGACPYQPRGLRLDGTVRAHVSGLPGARREQARGRPFRDLPIGAVLFIAGIPLAQAHQTIALAVIGSLLVLAGLLVFLANFLLNAFSAKARG